MAIPINTVAGPDNPNPATHYMANTHDIDVGSGKLRFATDYLGMQFHGDCHTHMDALPITQVSSPGLLNSSTGLILDAFARSPASNPRPYCWACSR